MSGYMVQTLKKNASFRSVMNHGKKWITPGFIAFFASKTVVQEYPSEDTVILVGVVASKKVGNAVKRNRAKRRLREVLRLHEYPEALRNHCVVLIARQGAIDMPFEQLQKDLKWAFKRTA